MNPSNTQETPEIKKVFDSNGEDHTVIPTPHTHAQSEVSGLATALNAKADTSSVNAALNGKASVAQVNTKASKVSGAVSGHFAGLDSNGDLTDSGVSAGSFSNRVAAGTNGSIIVADASGTIGRSPKTIADLMPATAIDSTPTANSTNLVTSGGVRAALNGKMENKTIDQEPVEGNATHLISSHGVAMGLKDAISGVITNTILSITLVQDMSGHLLYSSENIISSIKEKSIATAMLEIRKQLDGTLLGKTVVLVSWENSTTGTYKDIYIYTNEAEYNLRKTVADGTWRKLTKTGSSIESYLPE